MDLREKGSEPFSPNTPSDVSQSAGPAIGPSGLEEGGRSAGEIELAAFAPPLPEERGGQTRSSERTTTNLQTPSGPP